MTETIYCNGVKTQAIRYNGHWFCDRCGKAVKIVPTGNSAEEMTTMRLKHTLVSLHTEPT